MNVLKELISQVKRKEIKNYDDLMAVIQYVKEHKEINKKDMFAYKFVFITMIIIKHVFVMENLAKECVRRSKKIGIVDRYF